jgi:D-alanyl-D-alanine carboxypeptidase (penicillin-binding protein 5/6)
MKKSSFFKTITLFINFVLIFLVSIQQVNFANEIITQTTDTSVLIDFQTGKVLYDNNKDKRIFPASTTKILTALIILEQTPDLEKTLIISANPPRVSGSRIGFMEGEEILIKDALYAMLISSANDAALALAEYNAGSMEEFAKKMNERAKEIGAINSNFISPHGLHDENHYSTAYDMALIAKEAYKNEVFSSIVSIDTYNFPPTNKEPDGIRIANNTNKFLNGVGQNNTIVYENQEINIKYEKIDGIKTGYTPQANNCLVTTAKNDSMRFISVVMNSIGRNVYLDSRILMDFGLDNFKSIQLVQEDSIFKTVELENSKEKSLDLRAVADLNVILPIDTRIEDIIEEIIIDEISIPIAKDQVLGRVIFKLGEENLGEISLISDKDVFELSFFSKLANSFLRLNNDGSLNHKYYLDIFINIIITILLWRLVMTFIYFRRKKKRKKRKK